MKWLKFSGLKGLATPIFLVVAVVLLFLVRFYNIDGFGADVSSSVRMYDNNVIYNVGSVVSLNNILYEMVEGAGAPGYSPLRQGDKLWQRLYDNNTVYKVGDVIRFRGSTYQMVEGAGAPGYPPLRPGDKLWAEQYSDSKIYSVGNTVTFQGGVYTMVEGAGTAGYNPERPGDKGKRRG